MNTPIIAGLTLEGFAPFATNSPRYPGPYSTEGRRDFHKLELSDISTADDTVARFAT